MENITDAEAVVVASRWQGVTVSVPPPLYFHPRQRLELKSCDAY